MAPIVPGLMKSIHVRTRLAKRELREATADELLVFRGARRRARRDQISFTLTKHEFDLLVTRANGRCESTGFPFNNDFVPGQRIRPNRLSIDRLSNSSGYSMPNCWLVLASENISRNSMGLQQLHVQKLLYYAQALRLAGGPPNSIPDKFVLRRHGDDPSAWEY